MKVLEEEHMQLIQLSSSEFENSEFEARINCTPRYLYFPYLATNNFMPKNGNSCLKEYETVGKLFDADIRCKRLSYFND
jgi:hypothetical protein